MEKIFAGILFAFSITFISGELAKGYMIKEAAIRAPRFAEKENHVAAATVAVSNDLARFHLKNFESAAEFQSPPPFPPRRKRETNERLHNEDLIAKTDRDNPFRKSLRLRKFSTIPIKFQLTHESTKTFHNDKKRAATDDDKATKKTVTEVSQSDQIPDDPTKPKINIYLKRSVKQEIRKAKHNVSPMISGVKEYRTHEDIYVPEDCTNPTKRQTSQTDGYDLLPTAEDDSDTKSTVAQIPKYSRLFDNSRQDKRRLFQKYDVNMPKIHDDTAQLVDDSTTIKKKVKIIDGKPIHSKIVGISEANGSKRSAHDNIGDSTFKKVLTAITDIRERSTKGQLARKEPEDDTNSNSKKKRSIRPMSVTAHQIKSFQLHNGAIPIYKRLSIGSRLLENNHQRTNQDETDNRQKRRVSPSTPRNFVTHDVANNNDGSSSDCNEESKIQKREVFARDELHVVEYR